MLSVVLFPHSSTEHVASVAAPISYINHPNSSVAPDVSKTFPPQKKNSNVASIAQLEHRIENHRYEQRNAKNRRAILVVVLDGLALSDRLASVEIDANGIEEREDRNDGEGARSNERGRCWFCPKVEEGCCDGADINGKFKLCMINVSC